LVWSAEILVLILPSVFNGAIPNIQINISRVLQYFILTLLIIGFISSSVDLLYLRFYYMMNDYLEWFPIPAQSRPDRSVGARTYYLRLAYSFIGDHYPLNTVIQHNPDVSDVERASALYSFRQVVILDTLNPTFFGVNEQELKPVFNQIVNIFEASDIRYSQVVDLCKDFKINLLIVKDLDMNFQTPESWVFKHQPVYQNTFVKVFECDE